MVGNDNHYILCLLTETHFYNRCILDPEFDAIVSGWSRAVCRVIIALYAFDLCTRKFKMIHLLCSFALQLKQEVLHQYSVFFRGRVGENVSVTHKS